MLLFSVQMSLRIIAEMLKTAPMILKRYMIRFSRLPDQVFKVTWEGIYKQLIDIMYFLCGAIAAQILRRPICSKQQKLKNNLDANK